MNPGVSFSGCEGCRYVCYTNPNRKTSRPKPSTPYLKTQTANPTLQTLNPTPYTPKPKTHTRTRAGAQRCATPARRCSPLSRRRALQVSSNDRRRATLSETVPAILLPWFSGSDFWLEGTLQIPENTLRRSLLARKRRPLWFIPQDCVIVRGCMQSHGEHVRRANLTAST